MQPVNGGLDLLHVTISENIPLSTVVDKLFRNLSIKDFHRHKGGGAHYQIRYVLKAGDNVLAVIYALPKRSEKRLYNNTRNCIQINGLAFSDSALNGLRPDPKNPDSPHLDLDHLCMGIIELDGHITAIDGYLDDLKGQFISTDKHVFDLSRPRKYKLHIRSNLIKDVAGTCTIPRIEGTSCYYGVKGSTQALIYEKHKCPHQGIHTDDNPMKVKTIRFELRLRKDHARRYGMQIIEKIAYLGFDFTNPNPPQSVTAIITEVIDKFFSYLEKPTRTNKARATLEAGWGLFIAAGKSSL